MIQPAFEILNQRGTPMFFSDTFANRPSSGIIGRIFISIDTAAIYRDTGTTWDLIADGGSASVNIYNSNGTLTGNRVVSYNSNYLSFTGGQTFFGSQTTSTGLVVINNSSSDAHLQVVGANAPSIRIDNAGFGATRRFVMGLATATNNFIQGATAGDICISTASSSPLLFGMWQSINASEVMRITTSNNVSIGYNVDLGYKLYVNGAIGTNGAITIGNGGSGTSYLYALSGSDLILNAGGDRITIRQTGNVIINNLSGSGTRMVVADASGVLSTQAVPSGTISGSGTTSYVPKFTGSSTIGDSNLYSDSSGNLCIGSSDVGSTSAALSLSIGLAGTTSGGIQLWAATNQTHYVQFGDGTTGGDPYRGYVGYTQTSDALLFGTSSSERGRFSNVGNLLIGTQTDSGYKLDVNGTGIFRGQLTASTTNGSTSAIFQNTNVQNSNGIELRGGTAGTALNWKIEKDNTLANALQITPSTAAGGTTYTTPLLSISSSNLVVNSSSIDLNPSSGSPNITLRSGGTFRGYIEGNASGGMSFGAGPSATIVQTITSGGNVLIGTTDNVGTRLNVSGVISSANSSFTYSTFDGFTDGNLYITANAGQANTTNSNIIFRGSTSGGSITQRAKIDSNGLFTIGSVYAVQKYLNVQDNSYFSDSKRQYAIVGMLNDNAVISSDWYSGAGGTTPPIAFLTGQVERMRISPSTGNLLIGTTTDAGYKLDVNGTGIFRGVLQTTSNFYSTGFIESNNYVRISGGSDTGSQLVMWANPSGNTFLAAYDYTINTGPNNSRTASLYIGPTGSAVFYSGVEINGQFKVDGQTAATAGGSSGQHLIINCDGTTYKIALLNN